MYFTLTVDPGVGGTGVAQWSNPLWPDLVPPVTVDCFRPAKAHANTWTNGGTWEERCDSIISQFTDLMISLQFPGTEESKVTIVHIEYPALMLSGGAVTATRGDLVKLAVMVGRLAQVAQSRCGYYSFLPVNEWKGTMPKKVVDRRIEHRLGMKFDEHISDSVGMGLYLKGHFNQQ